MYSKLTNQCLRPDLRDQLLINHLRMRSRWLTVKIINESSFKADEVRLEIERLKEIVEKWKTNIGV